MFQRALIVPSRKTLSTLVGVLSGHDLLNCQKMVLGLHDNGLCYVCGMELKTTALLPSSEQSKKNSFCWIFYGSSKKHNLEHWVFIILWPSTKGCKGLNKALWLFGETNRHTYEAPTHKWYQWTFLFPFNACTTVVHVTICNASNKDLAFLSCHNYKQKSVYFQRFMQL